MNDLEQPTCTAFQGFRRVATGRLTDVARMAREALNRDPHTPVLLFEDGTAKRIEVDFRGTPDQVVGRILGEPAAVEPQRGPGRPRLGVVAREVTLLPRHWEWLNEQPGGASVALRRLVEEARKATAGQEQVRKSREAAYRFMSALGGNLPRFEEASRALFAGDRRRLEEQTDGWPEDVRDHLLRLLQLPGESGE